MVDDIHGVRQSVFADRQTLDIFPFNATELVRHWFLTLGDQLKTNLNVFKEAFFKRFREDGCESDLDDVKQEDQESVDNFIHVFQLTDCDLDLSETHLVSRAINNLKTAIRGQMFILKPKSMEDLGEAAKTLESGLMLTSSTSSVNLSETIQATVTAAMI